MILRLGRKNLGHRIYTNHCSNHVNLKRYAFEKRLINVGERVFTSVPFISFDVSPIESHMKWTQAQLTGTCTGPRLQTKIKERK